MLRTLKCPVIALEEHYWDKELAALFAGAEGVRDPQTLTRRGRADACTACRRCLNCREPPNWVLRRFASVPVTGVRSLLD
jgi:hypothetical protein